MRLNLIRWLAVVGVALGGLAACQVRPSASPALGAGPLGSMVLALVAALGLVRWPRGRGLPAG